MAKLKSTQNSSTFSKRLRDARLKGRLSQKQLGIQAGIDESSASARVNQWERGKHNPDLSIVERLAVVLAVPAPYFYARDDDLAAWILGFQGLSAAARAKLARDYTRIFKAFQR